MKKRYKKRKRTISNLDVVNSILTTLLVVLGILVGWTMFKYDFLNFRGINFGIIIVIMISIIVSVFLIIKKKAKVFNTIMLVIMMKSYKYLEIM